MSLLRSFTQRLTKPEAVASDVPIGRAASQRNGKPISRSQISAPLALVSTTNMLSYDAPNISGTVPIGHRNVSSTSTSSAAESEEGEQSDASTMSIHSDTDASSIDEASAGPEPNHLSCYFKPSVDTRALAPLAPRPSLDVPAPAIPQRVPSHSKKAHESVHRKRSVQRMMSPPASIIRKSTDMFSVIDDAQDPSHPFSNELAQLDEAVEDLGAVVQLADAEADLACMASLDLARFCASEYLAEIHDLFAAEQPSWI